MVTLNPNFKFDFHCLITNLTIYINVFRNYLKHISQKYTKKKKMFGNLFKRFEININNFFPLNTSLTQRAKGYFCIKHKL